MQQVGIVLEVYLQDNDEFVPSVGGWSQTPADADPRWDGLLAREVSSPKVLDCPPAVDSTLGLTATTPGAEQVVSYAWSRWFGDDPATEIHRRTDVSEPEMQIMLVDQRPWNLSHSPVFSSPFPTDDAGTVNPPGMRYRHGSANEATGDGSMNLLTLDLASHSETLAGITAAPGPCR